MSFRPDSAYMLIETVNAGGGIVRFPDGGYAPVASQQWPELGEAYMKACDEKGIDPIVVNSDAL